MQKILFFVLWCLVSRVWAVDINTATVQQLTVLKGIGVKTAERIIEERQRAGPFVSLEDFSLRVKGMGKKKVTKLQEQGLRLGTASTTISQATVSSNPSSMHKDKSYSAESKTWYVRPKQALSKENKHE